LLRFAKELRGGTLHMDIISLGQGQGPRAEELITKSLLLKGRWIFLQNCHLAASFMPRLQAIVSKYSQNQKQTRKIVSKCLLFLLKLFYKKLQPAGRRNRQAISAIS
jgi:hypothetical protein